MPERSGQNESVHLPAAQNGEQLCSQVPSAFPAGGTEDRSQEEKTEEKQKAGLTQVSPAFLFAIFNRSDALDFAGLQSTCGSPYALRVAVNHDAHFLQVGTPSAAVRVHRV